MVRFGAEMVFSSKDSTITDEDIDRIIAKGEETTAELDAKMKKFTEDAIKFKMVDSMGSLSLSLSLSHTHTHTHTHTQYLTSFFSPQLLNCMILMMIR
jgi:hypothetical protein